MSGSKEKAFEERWKAAGTWFAMKKYRWALKVFNRAWLINPKDARIFNAYGILAETAGKDEEAFGWYKRGAEKGDFQAQYNVAGAYFCGVTVARDFSEASKWFKKAAEQNITWAQNMLGVCYEYGFGVPQNRAKAEKWYQMADAQAKAKPGYQIQGVELRGLTRDAALKKISAVCS